MPPRRSDRKRSAPESYTDTSSTNKKPRTTRSSSSSSSTKKTTKAKPSTAKASTTKGKSKGGRSSTNKSTTSKASQSTKGTSNSRSKNLKKPRGGSKAHPMNDDQAQEGVEDDKKEGKASTTQAGRYVHEEMERMNHPQEGVHKPVSRQQAIAIGLSKARKAGVKVPNNPNRS